MMTYAIETRSLVKSFGDVTAVDGMELEIEPGRVFGLIGHNGAGKTTTIRLLMGLLQPTRGQAMVLGADLLNGSRTERARVAYVSQQQRLCDWMTVEELCHYVGHFYRQWDHPYARGLSDKFGLRWRQPIGVHSGGQQRKVALLVALAARPEVLLLDEPAAGLDPLARRQLLDELIDTLARGDVGTVLLSTHIINDLERLAEDIGVMAHGRMVAAEPLDHLLATTRRVQLVFDAGAPPEGFTERGLPGVVSRLEGRGPVVSAVVRAEPSELEALRNTPGARVDLFPLGLEEIYIELFGGLS